MAGTSVWFQREISLPQKKRGCHLVTSEIEKLPEIKKVKMGLCHVLSKSRKLVCVLAPLETQLS